MARKTNDEAPDADGLTLKQRRFVNAFLGETSGNATEAARLAGYAGDDVTLASVGYENLRKPQIAAEIDRRMEEETMSANEILRRLSDQARLNLDDFYDFHGSATPFLNLTKAKQRGKMHLLAGLEYSTTGKMVLKFHPAQNALVQLGRYRKLFTDKVDHDFSNLPDSEIVRRVAAAFGGVPEAGAESDGDAAEEGALVQPALPDD